MFFSSKSRAFVNLVSLQDPDLDTKMAARQMKADSSRHKSMHSSLVVAVTVLLSAGLNVESSHTVKLYVLFPHLASKVSLLRQTLLKYSVGRLGTICA